MNSVVEKIYDITKDVYGQPQTYKGIDFFPIKVKDVETKQLLYKLFFHPKNYIPDKVILKMSYLKFILYIVNEWYRGTDLEMDVQSDLIKFLNNITQKNDVLYKSKVIDNGSDIFNNVEVKIVIGGVEFSEQEFDNIREIVLEQSGYSLSYIEEYNPELEKRMEFFNRNVSNTDYKDEIYSFCALTGMSEDEVGEKTLYQFKSRFEREILVKEYELFKPLEVSGQVSSKSGKEIFKHYLSHISKGGRYSAILIDKDQFLEESGLGKTNSDGNINV